MSDVRIGMLEVAALLVSASCGVGFLFGSGELAMSHGMAGALYPWLTGIGMLLLAAVAGRVWQIGVPIWELFGRWYGPAVNRCVAGMSVIWMTGVLAAQIRGASTSLTLAGTPRHLAMPIVMAAIGIAAHLRLGLASKVFSICLFASSIMLVCAVVSLGGTEVYLHAVPRFVSDVQVVSGPELMAMTISIVFLVVTGADYQQFVISAKRRRDAVAGCALAAFVLIVVGALPAAAVIAARDAGVLTHQTAASEAIPFVLSHVSSKAGRGAGAAMLVALLAAALGSGAAVVRAMTGAVLAFTRAPERQAGAMATLAVVVLGALVADRGQSIISTMIDLNIVYIASIAPLFGLLLLRIDVPAAVAQRATLAGSSTSGALYLTKWSGLVQGQVELAFLATGVLASAAVLVAHWYKLPRTT
ncbi:hypothetical protein [Burkholderia sp. SCN-KJ]|uniref:hypothetical protein n=1 Tax=Burkholderia sp. SCN-KJ TaxID=2969248 RepID=UPI00214FB891|nr:hypothetical protein [Burkholderia sp. SCN-KJ]MCR4471358.1 hypothetical protein [Burkholderia sp. SCN-KJ]